MIPAPKPPEQIRAPYCASQGCIFGAQQREDGWAVASCSCYCKPEEIKDYYDALLKAERDRAQVLVEALEVYSKDGGMVFSQFFEGPGWSPKEARQALAQYRGEK